MADKKDAFWWFGPETAHALARRIESAGTGFVRLEVRVDKARPGEPMTFRVVTSELSTLSHGDPDLNDSHLCPPACPGD